MKKIVAFFLALSMAVVMLAGCGAVPARRHDSRSTQDRDQGCHRSCPRSRA